MQIARIFAIVCGAALLGAPALAAGPAMPAANAPATPAASVKIGSLVIESPWMRATLPGARIAGGFLRITNNGSAPDRFLGGTAAFADRVEIHQTTMADNVAKMRELADGLEIQPGQTVEFKPGSYHLMFVGVKTPLRQGTRAKAVLAFEKAGKAEVVFDVVPAGAGAPAEMPMHMH